MSKLYIGSGKHYVAKKKEPKKLYLSSSNQDITGAAYLGGKVAAGAASIGVGAWNLIAGTFDQITGNTYAAEKRYAENSARAFSDKLDSMYDANGAMRFAGAVAEGVGQFIPTALISLIPVAGVPLSQGIQFAGYTGMNVEDAYRKTGSLGAREYLYGAAMGGFETALEFVGGKVGGWIGGTKVGGRLLGVSDNVAGAAMKATSGRIGARAATVGARTLMGGASEFTEEFIEAYGEVALQRALQIDPNASIKIGEALYAGAVGFAAGASISGATSVLNTRGAQMTGARIMRAGEADITISAATEIASAFKANGRVESDVVKTLQDNLALWERVSDKTSGDAQMILGNIEVAMNVVSAMSAQQGTVRAVTKSPEKFLAYARSLFGDGVTVADLQDADSRVVRFIAASNWATGEADALAIRAKRTGFTSAIEAEMRGGAEIPPITKLEGVNGDAVYKSPDGDYIFLSEGKNGLYTVMKGKDLDNLRAFEKDGSAAIEADEVKAALIQMLTKQAPRASAEEQRAARASVQERPAQQEGEKDPKKPTEKRPEESTDKGEGDATGGKYASESPKGNVLSDKVSRERARLIDEYDAEVQDKARKLLGKRVDGMSADRRIAVYEAILSGKSVEEAVLRAACYFISKRPGLYIRFDRGAAAVDERTAKGGFHKVLFGGKARLVLAANGPKGLRKVLIHEVFHDIAHTKAGEALIRAALEATTLEEAYGTARLYGDFYAKAYEAKGVESFEKFFTDGKYDKERRESVLEAISAYEKRYASILPRDAITEELVADTVAERIGNERFFKMAKDTSAAGLVLRGVRRMLSYLKTEKAARPLYTEAVEMENLFLDAVSESGGQSEGTRFALEQQFGADLQAWFDSTGEEERAKSGKRFFVGRTGEVLKSIGVKDADIYFGGSKINRILRENKSMTLETIKKAVTLLEDPILVMESRTVEDSIVLFGEVYTDGQKPVMISLLFNPKNKNGEILDYAVITSAYGRRASNLQNLIDKSLIYYINEDKKRTDAWLQALGLQLPSAVTAYGSINSIPQNGENVKSEAQKNASNTRYSVARTEKSEAEQTVERSNAQGVTGGVHARDKAKLGRGWFYRYKDTKESLRRFLDLGYFVADGVRLSMRDKDLGEVAKYLWKQANSKSQEQMEAAADTVADYFLAKAITEDATLREKFDNERAAASVVKPYFRKLFLSVAQRTELQHALGTKRARRFINAFSVGQSGGIDIDSVLSDINEQLRASGYTGGLLDTENELNGLVDFALLYEESRGRTAFMRSAEEMFERDEDIERFRAQIKEGIREAMRENGKPGMLRVLTQHYEAVNDRLYERWRETREKYEGAVKLRFSAADAVFLAREVGEMVTKRKYVNAAEVMTPEIEAVGRVLASVATPRKIKDKAVREAMKALAAWYTPRNLDGDSATENGEASEASMYHPDIKEKMEALAAGDPNAQLTYEEVRALAEILNAVRHVIQSYDIVVLQGKRLRATEQASAQTARLKGYLKASDGKPGKGLIGKMFHNAGTAVGKRLKDNFLYRVMTPRQVVQSLEWYDKDGVLTKAFDEIRDGVAGAGSDYADMMRPVMEFLDSHKKYEKRLTKTLIPYEGEEMSVAQAIALYMTTKREQAAEGFEASGFRYMGKDGKVRHARPRAASEIREEISAALSDKDKAYIKVLEGVFEKARALKVDADGQNFGYTNVEEGYYFPISRDTMEIARRVSDLRQTVREMAVVGNKSFNKNTVQGAKNALFIGDVTMITEAHAMGVAQYANLYMPFSAWDRLWNKKVDLDTDGKAERLSIRQIVGDEIWTGRNKRDIADTYFRQLFADIQGVRAERRDGDGFYAALRSTYVSAALGFNLSSILKQTGSFASAMVYLNPMDLARGLVMKGNREEMWKYSKVANGRMFERGRFVSADANTRLENAAKWVKKFGEATMVGVEGMDNLVIGRLWNACQQSIARTKGLAIGTKENMEAAGKLLDTVINETQSSSTQDTRSAFQRGGAIAQTLTMFTSDAVKQVSFLYEGAARLYAARLREKMGTGSKAEVKEAQKFLTRSVASFAATTALVVAITQFIKWLLGRKREEGESIAEDVANETLGQVLGIFPLVSDIYGKVANNYDVDSFAFEAINGVLDGAVALGSNLHKAANGEAVSRQEILKPARTLVYELSNFTGIPVRSFINYVVGVTKKISPEAGYGWDSLFEKPNYEADLLRAIEKGDERLAAYVMELSLRHRVSEGDYTSPVAAELLSLTWNGFSDENDSVTPSSIPSSVNGVAVNAEQHKAMQRIYGGTGKALAEMIESDAYNALTDEERVDAINTVYRTYLGLAKARVMPTEEDKRTAAVWAAPLLSAQSYAVLGRISGMESTDEASRSEQVTKYLNELDISNDERYLILFAAGYRSKTVLERVKRIVSKSDALSDAEKQAFVKQYLS